MLTKAPQQTLPVSTVAKSIVSHNINFLVDGTHAFVRDNSPFTVRGDYCMLFLLIHAPTVLSAEWDDQWLLVCLFVEAGNE